MNYIRLSGIPAVAPFEIGQVLHTSSHGARSQCDLKTGLQGLGAIRLGPGRYAYRGVYAKAIEHAREIALDIGQRLGYEQWYLHKLVPSDVLSKFGCIEAWPQYLLKAAPFAAPGNAENTITDQGEAYFLDPVQCASFYEALATVNLEETCPLKIIDISGYTYRNEFVEKLNGTMKTVEFLRAEYIFVGNDFVKQARNQILHSYVDFFEKMQIKWRLAVGAGCYDTPAQIDLDEYAKAKEIESVPVLDIEVFSPSLNDWIEVVGASYLHGHKLERFGYCKEGYESGCVGVGLTRLAGIALEYLGPEVESWTT